MAQAKGPTQYILHFFSLPLSAKLFSKDEVFFLGTPAFLRVQCGHVKEWPLVSRI
nr:hypothetical protein Iba_chr06eCG2800 [Ipomoea batatas]